MVKFFSWYQLSSKYDQQKYLDFCKNFDQTLKMDVDEFVKIKQKNKKLKVGFLSADFKYHSVSFF